MAFFKSGWLGTHNIKGGYQFNKLSNVINQHGNIPSPFVRPGAGLSYTPATQYGADNCFAGPNGTGTPAGTSPGPALGTLESAWGGLCAGQYGYGVEADASTVLKNAAGGYVPAVDNNHALFVQDAWTVGHGLTLNLGIRLEKEVLPAPPGIGLSSIKTINFSWADKIAPRLGAAWGSRDGKMKIFGSYGVINDVMKLLLAQTSFGAQQLRIAGIPLVPIQAADSASLI